MKLDDITRLWQLQDARAITIADSEHLIRQALQEQQRANLRELLENILKVAFLLAMAAGALYRGAIGADLQPAAMATASFRQTSISSLTWSSSMATCQ